MSYQAMGAVQMSSQFRDDDPANFAPFKILLAYAWFADAGGVVGQAGDYRKCPGQQAIADRAGVHRNTVANWLPRLYESGELEIVEEGGAGRGSWAVHRLNLPMADVQFSPEIAQASSVNKTDYLVQLTELIAQRMDELVPLIAQGIAQGAPLIAQENCTNSTSPPEVGRRDPYDPIDPLDPEEEEELPPPPLPAPSPAAEAIWETAVDLVQRWAGKRGIYREIKIKPTGGDPPDDADFYRPAARLVNELDGDGRRAWELVQAKYLQMLAAGYPPTRLEPVVVQVLADLDRENLPARASPNGRHPPGSEIDIAAIFDQLGLSHE